MIVRRALLDSIPILFYKDEKKFQDYVSDFRKVFKSTPIEDIAFPRGITDLSKYNKQTVKFFMEKEQDKKKVEIMKDKLNYPSDVYIKGTPVHCKGALVHNYLLDKLGLSRSRNKIKDGDKIKYVYLKMPNPIKEEVIAFQDSFPKEFQLEQYIDWDKMFDKQFISPIEKMSAPIGWNPIKQSNLDDFFSF